MQTTMTLALFLAATAGAYEDPLARAGPHTLLADGLATTPALLRTAEGLVKGTTVPPSDPSWTSVARFGNIPYAKPAQRWTPPVTPPDQYPSIRDGSNFGPTCVQPDGSGSEDCLLLNLFTPSAALGKPSAKLPILLWVHGGAYQTGASNNYDATNLVGFLNGAAAVVTINYRLHIFGFLGSKLLRHRDAASGSTGMYGLQDQRAAFAWVKRNAASFGGDPDRITIFGESAGAGSVSSHLVLPKSAGLFNGAIVESGSFGSWSARPLEHAESIYAQVLEAARCADDACLATRSSANLTAVVTSIPAGMCCNRVPGMPYIPWAPTLDGVEWSVHPYLLAEAGNLSSPVPIMQGTNVDEGAMFEPLDKQVSTPSLESSWAKWYAPSVGPDAAQRLTSLYLSSNASYPKGIGTRAWWAAQRSLTVQAFAVGASMLSRSLSNKLPVFQYLFAPATHTVVYHGDEVPYVFLNPNVKHTDEDVDLAKTMASMWAAFAATGNPSLPAAGIDWPRYDAQADGPYLRLDVAQSGRGITNETGFENEAWPFFSAWSQSVLR